MKRVNIQAAFVGEPTGSPEGLETADSDEAVVLLVRGGEVTFVVPSATAEDRLVPAASHLRGSLHLENQRVLTFEIQADSVGAFFEDEPAAFHRRREEESSGDLFRATSTPLLARSSADTVPVATIMSREIVTVRPSTTVHELATLLAFHRISGVPVVGDDGRLIGVVTESDVIARGGESVGEMMTSGVVAISEDTTIAEAAALLSERRIRRLPVSRDERVVGLVSQADVIRWLAGV